MKEWAMKELERKYEYELEGEDPNDPVMKYIKMCCDSAGKAYSSLCDDGHTGSSIQITKKLLMALIDTKPLTPLTGEDDEWFHDDYMEEGEYQNNRYPSLFKYTNPETGEVRYRDVNRYIVEDVENKNLRYHSSFIEGIMAKSDKIVFPYAPLAKPIVIGLETFNTVEDNADEWDTQGIIYLKENPSKTDRRVSVGLYFKKNLDGQWENIDEDEYKKRKLLKKNRHRKSDHQKSGRYSWGIDLGAEDVYK